MTEHQDQADKPAFVLRLVVANHSITPRLRSIHTTTGTPVNGLDARDYPLIGICLECGKTIRCGNYLADWRHVEN